MASTPSDPARRKRLRELFDRAFELPAEERRTFLERESTDDPTLRVEVEALLESLAAEGAERIDSSRASSSSEETLEASVVATLPSDTGPGKTWGHLAINQKLGEGHFGNVYLCYDKSLDREIALKLFKRGRTADGKVDSSVLARIVAEGRLLARITHPNVLKVHGVGVHDGEVGLWMEYVRGKTLEELLKDHGRFGAREASVIGAELCGALAAMHREGVIHRDIKAHNVIREEGGRFILMDFGAGQELIEKGTRQPSSGVGTPLYMSPEVLTGGSGSIASDIYSMGVLLFHLVTRSYPVRASTRAELRKKHAVGDLALLRDLRSDLPPGFVRVVEKALSPKPEDRFQSAGQMQAALEASAELRQDAHRGVDGEAMSTVLDDHGTSREQLERAVSLLTVLGIGTFALAFVAYLGFITSTAYRVAFSVPTEFRTDLLFDYIVWGVRALIPSLFYAVVLLAGAGALYLLARSLPSMIRRTRGPNAEIAADWPVLDWFSGLGRTHILVLTLIVGSLGLVAVLFSQQPILSAVFALAGERGSATDLTVLSSSGSQQHYWYTRWFVLLLVGMTWLTNRALARRPRDEQDRSRSNWALTAVVGLLLVTSTAMVLPWRLLWANDREVVHCPEAGDMSTKAYVIAEIVEGPSCRQWLFVPSTLEKRSVSCSDDNQNACRRTGTFEYVFDGGRESQGDLP